MAVKTDNFTDTNGVLLDAHVADTGETWSNIASLGDGPADIQSNQVQLAASNTGLQSRYRLNAVVGESSVTTIFTFSSTTGSRPFLAISLRDGAVNSFAQLERLVGGANEGKWNLSVGSGSTTALSGFDDGLPHTLKLTMTAAGVLRVYLDTVLKDTNTPGGLAATGNVVLRFGQTGSTGASPKFNSLVVDTAPGGSADHLTFLQQPTSVVAGAVITPSVTVRIEDALGFLTTSTANVAVVIGTNPSGATLSGTTPRAGVVGLATFNDLSLNISGVGFTLTVSSSGLTSATSSAFTVTGSKFGESTGQIWPKGIIRKRAHPDDPPASPSAFDEEFDGPLDPKWTATIPTSPVDYDVNLSWPSWWHLWARSASALPTTQANLTQTLTGFAAGTAFSCTMKISNGGVSASAFVGVTLRNGASNTDNVQFYSQLVGANTQVVNHKRVAAFDTFAISSANLPTRPGDHFLHVQRSTANVWQFWWSMNGRAWFKITDITLSFSIGQVVLSMGPNGQTAPNAEFGTDWFRVNWQTL